MDHNPTQTSQLLPRWHCGEARALDRLGLLGGHGSLAWGGLPDLPGPILHSAPRGYGSIGALEFQSVGVVTDRRGAPDFEARPGYNGQLLR